MDLQGIREAIKRHPFEPFRMCLADGRKLAIKHPEAVAVGRRRLIVVQPNDSWTVVEPLMVVSLDYMGTTRGNGRSKKTKS